MDNLTIERILTIRRVVRARQLIAVHLISLLLAFITSRRVANMNCANLPTRAITLHRQNVREELLHALSTSGNCRELIRMSEKAFRLLCSILERDGGLRATQRISVEEHVARFLLIIGQDLTTRLVSFLLRRSRSTASRCFHRVLNAIISLEERYLQQPTGQLVPKEIEQKKRFYPFFKDCVGAIDGTHVRVKVPNKDAPRYRGRKGYPTMNVLVACTFDLKFTYVLTGWEGTASDSRIIKNALAREDKLHIPEGKYYLVDAGLPHRSGLMTPYRGVRYHLKEYSARPPENSQELFNLRHASLRNAIERSFGVLKNRFPIINSTKEPYYSCKAQSSIFLACCILHNFLREEDHDKDLEELVRKKALNAPPEVGRHDLRGIGNDNVSAEQLRNSIASEMWATYMTYPDNEIDMSE